MGSVSYTEFRQNLAHYMDKVRDDRVELHVTRGQSDAVVVLAEDEYRSLMETLHLLRTPANLRDLFEGLAEAEAGLFVEHDPRQK